MTVVLNVSIQLLPLPSNRLDHKFLLRFKWGLFKLVFFIKSYCCVRTETIEKLLVVVTIEVTIEVRVGVEEQL